ncbi:hypothetical protein BC830DRAFT_653896 [Chytriomyces sp. MP71]|nr:hypothetical protein BC830DRAFT_653896 [Chytriomyces sp. MP71]
MEPASFRPLVLCSIVLAGKFFVTILLQQRATAAAGMRAPEDGTVQGLRPRFGEPISVGDNAQLKAHFSSAREKAVRWTRIVANDVESIPFSLVLFTVSALAGADTLWLQRAVYVFAAARVCHTVSYAMAVQPLRSLSFVVGWVTVFAALWGAVVAL